MRRTGDAVTGGALAALALAFLAGAVQIPGSSALWSWYDSPGLTPAILSVTLLAQALVLLVRGWPRGRRERPGAGWWRSAQAWGAGRLAGALAFCVAFVALMGRVPFALLVAMLVSGMASAFRGADLLRAVLLGAGTAVGVELVFGRAFFVPLP